MSTTVDYLVTKYALDGKDYEAGVSKIVNASQKGIGIAQKFLAAMVAMEAGLFAFGVAASKEAANFDAMVKALEALEGGANAAQKSLKELRAIGQLPGLGFQEAMKGYLGLRRAAVDSAQAFRIIRALGNASALSGGGREEASNSLLAISQMANTPFAEGQDMRQLMQAGVPIVRIFKEAFGTIDTEELKKKGISSAQAIEVLVQGLEKLPQAGNSAKNVLENLEISWQQAMVGIGTGINKGAGKIVERLSKALDDASSAGVFESVGQKLFGDFKSGLDAAFGDAVDSDSGMRGVVRKIVVGVVTMSAAFRNFNINLKEMIELWQMWSPAGAAFGRLSDIGQSPFQEGESEGNFFDQQMAHFDQMARKKKKTESPLDNLIKDLRAKTDSQTNYLAKIAKNTDKLVDIRSASIGGSARGEAAFNPVNVGLATHGGGVHAAVKGLADAIHEAMWQQMASQRARA